MTGRGEDLYGVLRHVRPIVLASARAVEARANAAGWTVGSRAVVETLHEVGPATVPHIAAHLDLARQNVQRQVDELVALDHVAAHPNPAHRRSVLVGLTPAGRRAFESLHAREVEELEAIAPECTDAEIATTTKVLAALVRDIRSTAAQRQEGHRERR